VKDQNDNKTQDWCADQINTSDAILLNQEIAVGRTLNILHYAAKQTIPFQVRDVAANVTGVYGSMATRYLNTLVLLGLLEKVTPYKYQPTALAKRMMNVEGEIKP
jgi:predicted transcriptional regulator of viral defense system